MNRAGHCSLPHDHGCPAAHLTDSETCKPFLFIATQAPICYSIAYEIEASLERSYAVNRTKGLPGRKPYVAQGEKMVALNVTLRPRQAAWLKERAATRHVPLSVILREALDQVVEAPEPETAPPPPKTGAELVERLTQNGLIGSWADRTDIGDTVEFARRLRERAQTRADRFDAEEIDRRGGAHPAGHPPDTAGQ